MRDDAEVFMILASMKAESKAAIHELHCGVQFSRSVSI